MLHPRDIHDKDISKADLTVLNNATEEAEANVFAPEFLMPKLLFEPHCRGEPSIAKLQNIADDFAASLTATAFQYYQYTREPVAISLSNGWTMRRFLPFRDDGPPRIRIGNGLVSIAYSVPIPRIDLHWRTGRFVLGHERGPSQPAEVAPPNHFDS